MANINKESLLTQEYVKELFDYKDGYLYWKVSKCYNGKSKVGDKAGWSCETHSGRRNFVRLKGKTFIAARLIFFMHYNWWPEMVDHEDRDCLNDKIENLRAANGCQNAANVKKKDNTTSKYMGVHFALKTTKRKLKTTGEIKTWVHPKWVAQISHNNERISLGNYKNEIEAALAYNKGAVKYHGEFAHLNIIRL